MANINVTLTNSTLNDEASVIRNLYESPKAVDFEQIEKELREIKASLKEGSPEFQAVDTLERGSKAHDWRAICSAIGNFTSQFTSATLANLAGACLSQLFNLSMPAGLLLLIPPVIVVAGSLMKKPTIPVMMISSAVAVVIGILVQGFDFATCATSMVNGFKMDMFVNPAIDIAAVTEQVPRLLERGGMASMMNTALMAFCAFAFIGAMTISGSLDVILQKLMKHIHGTGQLVTLTVLLGVIVITVIGEASVTFLMIGGLFRPEYIKRGLESKNLSRSLEDSITVVEPLVPWSLAGVYMASTLGVPTVQYAPWAVLCYTGVIFAIIWGFTGFGIAKIKKGGDNYDDYVELTGTEL